MRDYLEMAELSEEDKYTLRANYSDISKCLNPRLVISELEKQELLSEKDKTYLKKENNTNDEITEYIVFQLLICCGTYEVLSKLKDILTNSDQVQVLNYLPHFPSDEKDCVETVEQEIRDAHNEHQMKVDTVHSPHNDQPVEQEDSSVQDIPDFKDPIEQADANSQESTDDDVEEGGQDIVKAAGIIPNVFKRSKKNKKKKKDYIKVEENQPGDSVERDNNYNTPAKPPLIHNAGNNVETAGNMTFYPKVKRITKFTDAFLNYEPKRPGSHHGKGLCVVFSLFTEDMPGYIKDVAALEEFFSGIEYEVWCKHGYTNLTQEELFDRIRDIVTYINTTKLIDRLVVVILTHGKEDGILTCADKIGTRYEEVIKECRKPDGSKYRIKEDVRTKVEEIVEYFKHDTLVALKGMPKLFLIQACRGSEIVKAANAPGTKQAAKDTVDGLIDPTALRFKPVSPIEADIMICYAATERHSSLVNPHTGSWFIQQTLEVFKEHYKTQHVADMMTVVKLAVAELRGVIKHDDRPDTDALQIPCVFSTFRKRFYLFNQPQLLLLERGFSRSQLPPLEQNQYTSRGNQQQQRDLRYIKPHYV